MLHPYSTLVDQFKMCLEKMTGPNYSVVIRADKRPSGTHERQYNAPVVDDIAVVMTGDPTNNRDIVLQRRSNQLVRIYETHRSYDSLAYLLMFPRGEDGYHFDYRRLDPKTGRETKKKVSFESYYAYRMMTRPKMWCTSRHSNENSSYAIVISF